MAKYVLNPQSPTKEPTKRKETPLDVPMPSPKRTRASTSRVQEENSKEEEDNESTPKQTPRKLTPSPKQSPKKQSPARTVQSSQPSTTLTQRMNSVSLKPALKFGLPQVGIIIDPPQGSSIQTSSKLEKYYDNPKTPERGEKLTQGSSAGTPSQRRHRELFSEEDHEETVLEQKLRPARQTALQRILSNSQSADDDPEDTDRSERYIKEFVK
jgi:hypothetical protein